MRPVRADPDGVTGPTPGRARGREWRSTSHGFYVPADTDDSIPEQRILEQSVRLPEGGAVTGWAACRLHGGNFFDGLLPDGRTRMPVPLAIGGRQIRPKEGVLVLRDRLEADEVCVRHGIPCTGVERAVFDAARLASDVREAVVALDMAAAAELTSISRMARYATRHPGWRGAPQVRAALGLASEYSRSPNETRSRMVCELDAGLPRPMVNRAVFSPDGRLLGIADLLVPGQNLAGEFDGAEHRRAARHSRDLAKDDRFRGHGLEVFRIAGPDLRQPDLIVARIRAAQQRAARIPTAARTWTLTAPSWWEVSGSLDQRLDERDLMAEIHRQYEREGEPDIREIRGW